MIDATKYHVGYYPPPVEPGHVYEWPLKTGQNKNPVSQRRFYLWETGCKFYKYPRYHSHCRQGAAALHDRLFYRKQTVNRSCKITVRFRLYLTQSAQRSCSGASDAKPSAPPCTNRRLSEAERRLLFPHHCICELIKIWILAGFTFCVKMNFGVWTKWREWGKLFGKKRKRKVRSWRRLFEWIKNK